MAVRTYPGHESLKNDQRRRRNHNVFSPRRRRKLTSLKAVRVAERPREAEKEKVKDKNSFPLRRSEMFIEVNISLPLG